MAQELQRFDLQPAPLAAPITAGIFEGRVARTHAPGDGLRYDDGDEYRDATELALLVSQLPGTPITLTHPEGGLLSSGAVGKIVGRISAARVDGEHLVATLVITDDEALAAIAAGVHELSLGYRCTLDDQRYQRNIRVDHLALVPRARCGRSCALRADGVRTDCAEACSCGGANSDDDLTATKRHKLSPHDFAVPSTQSLPIENAEHVRAAMSRFGETHFPDAAAKRAAFHRIVARAHELGVDPSGFQREWSGRLDDADLRVAISVPISQSPHVAVEPKELAVNLEQALAALAAANEKNGALAARADQAERDRDAAVQAKADAETAKATAEVAKATAEADAASARKDAEAAVAKATQDKADADAAVVKAKTDAEALVTARTRERVQVETVANAILGAVDKDGKPIDRSDMAIDAIKREVVKHVDGETIADDAHPAYVDGMYAGARKRHATGAQSLANTREALSTTTQVVALDGLDAEKAAAKAARDRIADAWMTPTPKKGE